MQLTLRLVCLARNSKGGVKTGNDAIISYLVFGWKSEVRSNPVIWRFLFNIVVCIKVMEGRSKAVMQCFYFNVVWMKLVAREVKFRCYTTSPFTPPLTSFFFTTTKCDNLEKTNFLKKCYFNSCYFNLIYSWFDLMWNLFFTLTLFVFTLFIIWPILYFYSSTHTNKPV